MRRHAIIAASALVLIAALGACGKQGDLDRPGPLWGAKAKADYAAQKRNEAETATNEAQGDRAIPPQNPAVEPFANTAPVSQLPIPGEKTLPSGQGPE